MPFDAKPDPFPPENMCGLALSMYGRAYMELWSSKSGWKAWSLSRLSIHSIQIVFVVLLESLLCLLFWSLALKKGESFSLWHIYLWKVDWWQVFSNVKCLCKLMMIIWYAMPCYYHVKTVNYHLTSDIWHYIVTLTLFILFMHIFTLQVPC